MPGSSWSDFQDGEWLGIAFDCPEKGMVGKFKLIDPATGSITFYNSDGTPIIGDADKHKLHGVSITWTYPSSLFTAKETEEILYHCSYCGKQGHNRRTCPGLGETIAEVKRNFSRGDQIDPSDLQPEDEFMVEFVGRERNSSHNHFESSLFVVEKSDSAHIYAKTLEGTGPVGAFGQPWHFTVAKGTWNFYVADYDDAAEKKSKPLPLWELINVVLPASRLTLLYGPPGTGKTTAGNFLGVKEGMEVYNLTLTEETPAAELRGHFVPKGQEFVWMDGPALTAFKTGARLVLNEIDKASGDALTFCHALLDDPGMARITLPYKDEYGKPVTVTPGEGFNVIATMNGDPDDLPEALRDRFAVRIHVDKVNPNAIKSLPEDLRKIASKGISSEGERSVSIRGWNAFVQLREIVGEENAARAVFGPRAKTILNTIKIDGLAAASKKK